MSQAQKRHLDTIAFPGGPPAPAGKLAYQRRVAARQAVINIPIGQILAQLTFFLLEALVLQRLCEHTMDASKNNFPR